MKYRIIRVAQCTIHMIILWVPALTLGQSFDMESEALPDIKLLTVKSFNGCCAQKGYKAIYAFDDQGKVIKSSNHYRHKHLASYEYQYNSDGLLFLEIQTFDVNNIDRRNTTSYEYVFDHQGRIIARQKKFGEWMVEELYSDFDPNGKPQTEHFIFMDTTIIKKQYDSIGQVVLSQHFEAGEKTIEEEIRYNQFGDKVYSHIPTMLDPNTGKMKLLIGGSRHAVTEVYEHTYDRLNRWKSKYVIFEGRRVLLEKRRYR